MGVFLLFGQVGFGFQLGFQVGCQGFEVVWGYCVMVDQEQCLLVIVQGYYYGVVVVVVVYGQVVGVVERGFEGLVVFQ